MWVAVVLAVAVAVTVAVGVLDPVPPIPNSSMLVEPRIIAPELFNLETTVASKGGE